MNPVPAPLHNAGITFLRSTTSQTNCFNSPPCRRMLFASDFFASGSCSGRFRFTLIFEGKRAPPQRPQRPLRLCVISPPSSPLPSRSGRTPPHKRHPASTTVALIDIAKDTAITVILSLSDKDRRRTSTSAAPPKRLSVPQLPKTGIRNCHNACLPHALRTNQLFQFSAVP